MTDEPLVTALPSLPALGRYATPEGLVVEVVGFRIEVDVVVRDPETGDTMPLDMETWGRMVEVAGIRPTAPG